MDGALSAGLSVSRALLLFLRFFLSLLLGGVVYSLFFWCVHCSMPRVAAYHFRPLVAYVTAEMVRFLQHPNLILPSAGVRPALPNRHRTNGLWTGS